MRPTELALSRFPDAVDLDVAEAVAEEEEEELSELVAVEVALEDDASVEEESD